MRLRCDCARCADGRIRYVTWSCSTRNVLWSLFRAFIWCEQTQWTAIQMAELFEKAPNRICSDLELAAVPISICLSIYRLHSINCTKLTANARLDWRLGRDRKIGRALACRCFSFSFVIISLVASSVAWCTVPRVISTGGTRPVAATAEPAGLPPRLVPRTESTSTDRKTDPRCNYH